MTDNKPELLVRLDQAPMPPAPLYELLAAGRVARRRHRRAVVAGVASATALIVGGGPTAFQIFADPNSRMDRPTSTTHMPAVTDATLSPEEVAKAEAVARDLVAALRATVTSATAIARAGSTGRSNTGHWCTSGRELQIRLIGSFSHIPVGGYAPILGNPALDLRARAIEITVDAESGRACLIGVRTGKRGAIGPVPGSTTLSVGSAPSNAAPSAHDLVARVTDEIPNIAELPDGEPFDGDGRAVWDADSHRLTYISGLAYSGSCLPSAAASITTDGTVVLTIVDYVGRPDEVCTADAVPVAVVVEGVTALPERLAVTENRDTHRVDIATTVAGIVDHSNGP